MPWDCLCLVGYAKVFSTTALGILLCMYLDNVAGYRQAISITGFLLQFVHYCSVSVLCINLFTTQLGRQLILINHVTPCQYSMRDAWLTESKSWIAFINWLTPTSPRVLSRMNNRSYS